MMSKFSFKLRVRTWLLLVAFPIVVIAAEVVSWWWKNPPEPKEGRDVLAYSFPTDSPGSEIGEVDPAVVRVLSCSHSLTGWINAGEGERINVNYFEWNNVGDTGLSAAFGHSPEVCMGKIGNEVKAYLPDRRLLVDGSELVFDVTEFRDGEGSPLYIFKLSWAEGFDGENLLREGPNSKDQRMLKIQSTLKRRFPRYARVLMLGVYGARDDQEAWKLVTGQVVDGLSMKKLKE